LQLANAEIVDALEGCSADAADDGVAVAAEEGVGDRTGARRTIELGGGFGHGYLAAAMESTLSVLPSRVPLTVTFLPANFAGAFWSLRT
jgi:hypothetical protein